MGENVLMLKRKKEPWLNRWNGEGGKIEPGESPTDALYREILEETTINLKLAKKTIFAGIVTWEDTKQEKTKEIYGMYAFVSYLSDDQGFWKDERVTREGILAWKPIEWVCNKNNDEVAGNLPYLLPAFITSSEPKRYHCIFEEDIVKEVKIMPYLLPYSLV